VASCGRVSRKLAVGVAVLLAVLGVARVVLRPPRVPPEVIARAVVRDPAVLERAWQLPAAAQYRRVLRYQSNGSVCGPASLADVFRSLGERTVSEHSVLEGTGMCRTGMCFMGLTLDQAAAVARHHGGHAVTLLRGLSLDAFRRELVRSNDPHLRYVVNFTRKPIFGAGGGHFSPIGGYLEREDLAFVLDVNRAFRPWLLPSARLFAAVDTLDGSKKRGLLRIE
jgi:hypothetical protein